MRRSSPISLPSCRQKDTSSFYSLSFRRTTRKLVVQRMAVHFGKRPVAFFANRYKYTIVTIETNCFSIWNERALGDIKMKNKFFFTFSQMRWGSGSPWATHLRRSVESTGSCQTLPAGIWLVSVRSGADPEPGRTIFLQVTKSVSVSSAPKMVSDGGGSVALALGSISAGKGKHICVLLDRYIRFDHFEDRHQRARPFEGGRHWSLHIAWPPLRDQLPALVSRPCKHMAHVVLMINEIQKPVIFYII